MSKKNVRRLSLALILLFLLCTYLSTTFQSLLAARVTICRPSTVVTEDFTFYGCVIPSSAVLHEDIVYIAVSSEDVWGEVLIAQPMTVTIKDLEDGQVAVLSGLVGNERVIAAWDRPLSQGIRVLEE